MKPKEIFADAVVLIESDWNLKVTMRRSVHPVTMVLIESDWNLKPLAPERRLVSWVCINRIRLEFKV